MYLILIVCILIAEIIIYYEESIKNSYSAFYASDSLDMTTRNNYMNNMSGFKHQLSLLFQLETISPVPNHARTIINW